MTDGRRRVIRKVVAHKEARHHIGEPDLLNRLAAWCISADGIFRRILEKEELAIRTVYAGTAETRLWTSYRELYTSGSIRPTAWP